MEHNSQRKLLAFRQFKTNYYLEYLTSVLFKLYKLSTKLPVFVQLFFSESPQLSKLVNPGFQGRQKILNTISSCTPVQMLLSWFLGRQNK